MMLHLGYLRGLEFQSWEWRRIPVYDVQFVRQKKHNF